MRERSDCEACRELTSSGFNALVRQFRPEGAREFVCARSRNIGRKEHLQGAFARPTTRTHKISKDELCTLSLELRQKTNQSAKYEPQSTETSSSWLKCLSI